MIEEKRRKIINSYCLWSSHASREAIGMAVQLAGKYRATT